MTPRASRAFIMTGVFLVVAAVAAASGPLQKSSTSDPPKLTVTSPAFKEGGAFPVEFTCDGAGVSPPIEWSGAPEGTKAFAVNIWHVPRDGGVKSYWVVYDIPGDVTKVPKDLKGVGTVGINDKGRAEYDPMCSQGPGAKTYHITVHALKAELKTAPRKTDRAALLAAIKDLEIARGTMTYVYSRSKRD